MELIDVHCHIDDDSFKDDLDVVLSNARNLGVSKIITSALNEESISKTERIVEKYKNFIYYTVGLDYSILDESKFKMIADYIKEKRNAIVGIGEVGLDFFIFRNKEQQEKNIEIFKRWIDLALELDMPIVVHSRSAGKYAIKILIEKGARKVLMHAFDGSVGYAIEGVKKGFYFSIPPSVVRSEQKQNLVKHLPLENLMLESDSPVLGPEKGIRNTPSNVYISAGKIAELKKVPLEKVCEITSRNARNLFKLD